MDKKVYVQEVITMWTKSSRGAPESVTRNALPDAFELSEDMLTRFETSKGYSRVILREWNDFRVDHTVQPFDQQNQYRWPSLSIKFRNNDIIIAQYKYANSLEGVPTRSEKSAVSHELERDKLLQVKFNSRNSWPTGEWYYQLKTFNILLTGTPSSTMFTMTPVKQVHDLVNLW